MRPMSKHDDTNTVTLEQIRRHEATAKALDRQAQELQVEEQELGGKIVKALAGGGKQNAKPLRARRREVREQRADILEALPLLREQIATQRKQLGRSEATKRLTAIKRAYGSLVTEYAADGKRLVEAAQSYAAAKQAFSARFVTLKRLVAEQGALTDRFGLAAPTTLPTIVIPALHEKAVEAYACVEGKFLDRARLIPVFEKCEHEMRRRRTYEEIKGSPAFEIISAAGGLQPWPELSAKQREIVESRARQRGEEAAQMERFGPEAERSLQRTGLG